MTTIFIITTFLAFCGDTFALPIEPQWGSDSEHDAFSLENRRGPDPIHSLAPVDPNLGLPGGRLEADGGAGSGNYHLEIPLINLPGRGLDLSLTLFYNSQVWSLAFVEFNEKFFKYNADGDWPAPGANIGFGKLIFPKGGMLIQPNGTRIPLTEPIYERVNGVPTGRVTAKFADGSGGTVECPPDSNGCKRPGHIITVKPPNGKHTEFITKAIPNRETNVYYPQRIFDVHGNFIKIDYTLDTQGNVILPNIKTITDTVGRVVEFVYDQAGGHPVAIQGPDVNSGKRIYARFNYRSLDYLDNPGNAVHVIDGVFFPGNKTGYVFEKFCSAIPQIISMNRDMNIAEGGIFQKGVMTQKSEFSYTGCSLSDTLISYPLDLPSYSKRTDTWVDPVSGRESQAETKFSKSLDRITVTYPDGSQTTQTTIPEYKTDLKSVTDIEQLPKSGSNLLVVAFVSNNLHIRIFDANGQRAVDKAENELSDFVTKAKLRMVLRQALQSFCRCPDPNDPCTPPRPLCPKQEDIKKIIEYATIVTGYSHWDYGLANSTLWVASDGKPIKAIRYIWEQGKDNIPRQKEVQYIQREIRTARKVEFRYGANNLQVEWEIYSDNVPIGGLAHAPVVMRKKTQFVQAQEYLNKNFNLPFVITVDAGTDGSILEETSFKYDTRPLRRLFADRDPPLVGYGRNSDTFPLGPRGRLTRVTRYEKPDGPIVTPPPPPRYFTDYEYDETGNLRKVQTSGSQSSTEYLYDNTTQYSLPSSTTTGLFPQLYITERSTWDLGLGLPLSVTDADGLKTEFSYQPAAAGWRLKTSKSPTGVLTSYDYEDKYLNVGVKVTDAEGGSYYQSARYDGRGLLRESRKRLKDTGGHEIAGYQYDIMGRVTAEILPRRTTEAQQAPRMVQFNYDPAGRLVKRTDPDGSMTQWLYNDQSTKIRVAGCKVLGETIAAIDPGGRETWQSTDSFGRLGCVVEPHDVTGKPETGGLLTEYHRDALGRIVQIRQGSQVRSFRYDTLGRLTAAKYPERMPTLNDAGVYVGSNGKWSDVYEYDLLSNLVGYTDARGVKTRWEYRGDPLNRLISVVYDTSGAGDTSNSIAPTPAVGFMYVPSGDLRKIESIGAYSNDVIRERRGYDIFGRISRLVTEFRGHIGGWEMVSEYAYDSLNRLRTMKYPNLYENGAVTGTKALTYRYSNDGDLAGLELDGKKIVANAEYNVFGLRRLELSLGGTSLNEYYYYSSRNGRITKQTVNAGYGKTLLDLAYIYNREGVIGTKPEINIQYDLLNVSNDQTFFYDGLVRVSQATKGEVGGHMTRQAYAYDVHGNRTRVDAYDVSPSGPQQPLPADQADGLSFTVDRNTNRITSPDYRYDAAGNLIQGPGANGQPQRYIYDAAGRMVRVESLSGDLIEAYQYGADRRRIGVSSNLRDWRLSVWNGNTELARYDKPASGGLTWRDMPVYFGGRLLGDLRRDQEGNLRLFHPDQRGIALVTRLNNNLVESTRTSVLPYGKDLTPATRPADTPVFTSYERSAATGLDYAINRFYDSKQGRFLQTDPLGIEGADLNVPQTLNLYVYVMNDPINQIDYLGLIPEEFLASPEDLERECLSGNYESCRMRYGEWGARDFWAWTNTMGGRDFREIFLNNMDVVNEYLATKRHRNEINALAFDIFSWGALSAETQGLSGEIVQCEGYSSESGVYNSYIFAGGPHIGLKGIGYVEILGGKDFGSHDENIIFVGGGFGPAVSGAWETSDPQSGKVSGTGVYFGMGLGSISGGFGFSIPQSFLKAYKEVLIGYGKGYHEFSKLKASSCGGL